MNTEQTTIRFAKFALNPSTREFTFAGENRSIPDKIFDFLILLLEKPGTAIDKNKILDRLWPDQFVTEASLSRLVSDTRQLLAQDDATTEFIHTIRGKGFRFNPAIGVNLADSKTTAHKTTPVRATKLFVAGIATTLLVAAVVVIFFIQANRSKNYYSEGNTVLILPVNVLTGDDQDAWVEYGVMALLTRQLQTYDGLTVMDVNSVISNLQSIGYQHSLNNQDKFTTVCKALGCDVLLLSELVVQDGMPTLQYSLYKEQVRSPTYKFINSNILKAAQMLTEHALSELLPSSSERLELKHLYSDNASANQYFAIGVSSLYHGDYPAAQQNLSLALERTPNFFWAKAYLADANYRIGNYSDSNKLLTELTTLGLEPRSALFLGNLRSNLQYAEGDLEASLSTSESLVPIAESLGDYEFQGNLLMNTGTSYSALGDTDNAKAYLQNAISVYSDHHFKLREGQARMNLGNAFMLSENYSTSAMENYESASAIFRQSNASGYLAYALTALGGLKVVEGKFSEAKDLFLETADIYKTIDDQEGVLIIESELSNLAMRQGDMASAEQHALAAYEGAGDIFTYVRSHASALLCQIYLNTGRTEKVPPLLEEQEKYEWFDPRPAFAMIPASYWHSIGEYGRAVELASVLKQRLGDQWTEGHQQYLDAFEFSQNNQQAITFDYIRGIAKTDP